MKRYVLAFLAILLLAPMVPAANAQVVVDIGHGHRHHHRHCFYRHHHRICRYR